MDWGDSIEMRATVTQRNLLFRAVAEMVNICLLFCGEISHYGTWFCRRFSCV